MKTTVSKEKTGDVVPFDVYIVNFANADMVAHTGSLKATVRAIEILDGCLEKITNLTTSRGGLVVITADHGNAEKMIDAESGGPDTGHNDSLVPFIVIGDMFKTRQNLNLPVGILADVAPTVLSLLGISIPGSMRGRNLLPK